MLLLPIVYAFVWFFIHYLTLNIKSPYLKSVFQRNNFMTVLHALLVPICTVFYMLSLPQPFAYCYTLTIPMIHLTSATIGFYIFSTYNFYKIEKSPQFIMVSHHIAIAIIFYIALIAPSIQGFVVWVLVPQCTAAVYHSYLILKEAEPNNKKILSFLYELNFYVWIVFRFIFEAIILIMAIYYEYNYRQMPLYLAFFYYVIGLGISYYFNVYWLVVLVKNRRAKKLNKAWE